MMRWLTLSALVIVCCGFLGAYGLAFELELTSPAAMTTESKLIAGRTQPGALVVLRTDEGYEEQTVADGDGQFFFLDLPLSVGDHRLELTATDGEEERQEIVWVRIMDSRRFFGTGFASLELGHIRREGPPYEVLGELFVEGTTGAGYHYIVQADADPPGRETDTFRYPLVGDFSTQERTVNSSSGVYARVEKDDSHVQYGDFRTGFVQGGALVNYNRQLTGVHLRADQGDWQLDVGGATSRTTAQTDLLPGKGVSGFYYLSRAPLVNGTEQVRLLKDGAEELLIRSVDYDIDYRLGMLTFRRPVPIVDSVGEPVYISVTYEYSADGTRDVLAGSLAYASAQSVTQVRAVQDGDDQLVGATVRSRLTEGHTLLGEVAVSQLGDLRDTAWLVGWEGQIGQVQLDLVHSAKEAGFSPSLITPTGMPIRTTDGRLHWQNETWQWGASGSVFLAEGDDLTMEMRRWSTETKRSLVRTTLSARVGQMEQIGPVGVASKQTTIAAAAEHRFSERTSASVGRTEFLGAREWSRWDLAWNQTIRPGVRSTLSGQLNRDGVQSAGLALESEVSGSDESSTVLTSRGELVQTEEGWQMLTSQGMRSSILVTPNLGLDLGLHRIAAPETAAQHTGQVGFQYATSDAEQRIAGRLQWRADTELIDRLAQLSLHGRLYRGLSYAAQYRLTENLRDGEDGIQVRTALASLAYRPTARPTVNVLGMWRMDHGHPVGRWELQEQYVSTVSLEGAAWLTQRIELAAKYAVRSLNEQIALLPAAQTDTVLYQLRASYRVRPRWDLFGSTRLLTQSVSETRQQSSAFGFGYHLTPDGLTKLEFGHRSDGYEAWADDPLRAVKDTAGGLYLRLVVGF